MIMFLGKLAKVVPFLKVGAIIGIVLGAGYIIYDYHDTKVKLREASTENVRLDTELTNIKAKFEENKKNHDALQKSNVVINSEYRDAISELEDIRDQVRKLREQRANNDTESTTIPPVTAHNKKEVEARINIVLIDFNRKISCHTGDTSKC